MYENTGLVNELERAGYVVDDVEGHMVGVWYYVEKLDYQPFSTSELDELYDIATAYEAVEFVRQMNLRPTALISVLS